MQEQEFSLSGQSTDRIGRSQQLNFEMPDDNGKLLLGAGDFSKKYSTTELILPKGGTSKRAGTATEPPSLWRGQLSANKNILTLY